jgi:pyruvate/2-oxoglutarate dehydrogenase complex dihydrolipoamide dehydrogenase (E3) component
VDNVILAVGERADLQFLADSGVAYGNEVEVRFSGATSRADIFACGDVAFGHGTVTQAISTGRRVAEAVLAHVEQQKGRS